MVRELIEKVDEFVRGQAVKGLAVLVLHDRLQRDEVIITTAIF